MRNLVAFELRRLHRKNAQAERRMSMIDLTGKVKAGSQDMEKRTMRLVLGKGSDGQEILSAPMRWEAAGAGDMKFHAVPKDNEQMTMHSSSGTVGPTSLGRWATFDKDNEPPSKKKDEAVLQYGDKSRIVFKKDSIGFYFGDDQGFEVNKDEMKMKGRWRSKGGSRPASYKGSATESGDKNKEGNDDVLI